MEINKDTVISLIKEEKMKEVEPAYESLLDSIDSEILNKGLQPTKHLMHRIMIRMLETYGTDWTIYNIHDAVIDELNFVICCIAPDESNKE